VTAPDATVPTPDEVAAIVAAVDACWPRPAPPAREREREQRNAWRWSGRWWEPARFVAADRRRPS
jgi:hypothetical protein